LEETPQTSNNRSLRYLTPSSALLANVGFTYDPAANISLQGGNVNTLVIE